MPDADWWAQVVAERDRKVRLAIRVFIAGVKQSEERVDVSADKLDQTLPMLAEKHANMMAAMPGMVEIEFLDEPDVNQRFFRMGTDPKAMKNPATIDLQNPTAVLSRWGKGR